MTEMTGFAVNQISVQVWVTLGKLLKVSEHQQMELFSVHLIQSLCGLNEKVHIKVFSIIPGTYK